MELADLPAVEAVYGSTEGLILACSFHASSATALDRVPELPEWQDETLAQAERPSAFRRRPSGLAPPAECAQATEEAIAASPARRRLAYDELLASQLALALVRSRMRRLPGRVNAGDGRLVERLQAALPFGLTGAQARAVADIRRDLVSDRRMLRLLQGDVGSGKTVVALLAMASAIEAGPASRAHGADRNPGPPALRTHRSRSAAAAGLRVALLTGRDKAPRARQLWRLADGSIDIAVGTHALFQEGVEFRDLGLAVVDEQHRFGVHQRLALGAKGEAVDILVMTATPIPRTLALTYFGDMDVSVLDEKPAGRKPIATRLVPIERLDEVVGGIGAGDRGGAQVYWVCPLVEESENARPRRRGRALRRS